MEKYKKYAVLSCLCVALETFFELIIPMIMADIIDVGVAAGDQAYIMEKGAQMVICAGIFAAWNRVCQICSALRAGARGRTAEGRIPEDPGIFFCQYG